MKDPRIELKIATSRGHFTGMAIQSAPMLQVNLFGVIRMIPAPKPACDHQGVAQDYNRNFFSNLVDETCSRCGTTLQLTVKG